MKRDETELNTLLDCLVEDALAHESLWEPIYQAGVDYCYGNQLAEMPNVPGQERTQVNQIWPAIMQEQSLLAQRRPAIKCRPWEQSDTKGAKTREGVLQWLFEKPLDVQGMLLRAAMDGKVYGHYIARVWYDPKDEWSEEERKYKGAIKARLEQPLLFAMDPKATSFADAQYCFSYRSMTVGEAVALWPDKAEKIRAAAEQTDHAFERLAFGGEASAASSRVVLDGPSVGGEVAKANPHKFHEGRLASILSGQMENDVQTEFDQADMGDHRHVNVLEVFMRDRAEETVSETTEINLDELVTAGRIRLPAFRGSGAKMMCGLGGSP